MKKWAAFLAIVMLAGAIFSAPQTELISDDENLTVFEVRWDEPQFVPVSGDTVRIILDGCGPRGETGAPQLVGRAFNIAVPRDSRVSVRIDEVRWSEWMVYVPAPMPEKWSERGTFAPEKYSHPAGGKVKIAYDQIWRGVRVVGVDIVPIEYSPGKGIRYMKSAVVSVEHPGSAPIYDLHHYHPVMGQFYRATLVNPEAAIPEKTFSYSEWSPDSGAELLVITNSTFYEHAQPWINWKLLMGMPTVVALTDTIGTSVEDIRNFVYNAYHNWNIAPLYLLIIGDTEQIPTHTDYTYVIDDQYYCLVDGDDIFPDILPGRISVDNNDQLDIFITKLLNYEAEPDTIDRWYLRGIGVVRRDDCGYLGPVDSSYCAAVYYAMEACSTAGFYSTPVFVNCDGVDGIETYFDEGANLVTYRGQAVIDWWDPFGGLTTRPSGKHLPIYVSITCATGTYHMDDYPCEYVTRAGTVDNPRGGVAWIGQGRCSWYSLERSSLSKNIFAGWFEAKLQAIEAAHQYGRAVMYSEFGGSNEARIEYQSSGLVGSPEMFAWTGQIYQPDVTGPPYLHLGPNEFPVMVLRDGEPLPGARVSVHQGDRFSYGITDSSGVVTLTFYAELGESIYMVVTGPNIYPTIDTIPLSPHGVALQLLPVEYVDIVGDSDGIPNPGETIVFIPKMTNLGDSTSPPLRGTVRIPDTEITLIDSISDFSSIAPGDTVEGDTIKFTISPTHSGGNKIAYIEIRDTSGTLYNTMIIFPPITIEKFAITDYTFAIIDSFPQDTKDGVLERGEQVLLKPVLYNATQADCFEVSAKIPTGDWSPVLLGNDSIYIGDLTRDSSAEPRNGFILNIFANTDAVPEELDIPIIITGECPMYHFEDTIVYHLQLTHTPSEITGPDEYGYYIIDNTDIYFANHPDYVWNTISTSDNILSDITNRDDAKTSIALPFQFKFYGETYDTLYICTNGWISVLGTTVLPAAPSDIVLPTADLYNGIIAPFWADLNPASQGDIYYHYDPDSGKITIEYNNTTFYYTSGSVTFQMVIYDTAYHPTPTGDNEIYIYFNRITPPLDTFLVGIENETGEIGITYCKSTGYWEGAIYPDSGLALKITTVEPESLYPWVFFYNGPDFDDSLGNCDGIFDIDEVLQCKFTIKNAGITNIDSAIALISPTEFIEPLGDTAELGAIHIGEIKDNYSSPLRFRLTSACAPDNYILVPVKIVDLATGFSSTLVRYIQAGPSGISETQHIPSQREIIIYPNPFNMSAQIELNIPNENFNNKLNINLYDISGKLVKNLFSDIPKNKSLKLRIDASDLKSGIYFVKISLGNRSFSRKILIIK